jgi:hypothetical protein
VQTVPSLGSAVTPATYVVTITNEGPGAAPNAKIAGKTIRDQPVERVTASQGSCTFDERFVNCNFGELPPGGRASVEVRAQPASVEDLGFEARSSSDKTDPDPTDNFQFKQPAIVHVTPGPPPPGNDGTPGNDDKPPESDRTPPDSDISAPGGRVKGKTFRAFRGTASDQGSGVAAVEIAVVRVSGGRCTWLRGRTARFARGNCAERRWVQVSGREHWSYRLTKPLAKGSYRVYSRATDGDGLREGGWTRSDRNVRSFTVR